MRQLRTMINELECVAKYFDSPKRGLVIYVRVNGVTGCVHVVCRVEIVCGKANSNLLGLSNRKYGLFTIPISFMPLKKLLPTER